MNVFVCVWVCFAWEMGLCFVLRFLLEIFLTYLLNSFHPGNKHAMYFRFPLNSSSASVRGGSRVGVASRFKGVCYIWNSGAQVSWCDFVYGRRTLTARRQFSLADHHRHGTNLSGQQYAPIIISFPSYTRRVGIYNIEDYDFVKLKINLRLLLDEKFSGIEKRKNRKTSYVHAFSVNDLSF